jgi:hypothetical protein
MTAGRVKFGRLLADQSAPAAFDPDPSFGAVLIMAFAPVPIMAPVLVVTMKPDPAIMPYPMASHPKEIRAGRRRNLFGIVRGRAVFHDFLRWRWRRRTIMIIAITMVVPISMTVAVIAINPAAFDPYIAVVTAIPVARHPNGLGSRTAIPMAPDPYPMVSVPCPVAFHPIKFRAGLRASFFIPWRGWGFVNDDEPGQANGNTDIRPCRECCAREGA